MIGFDLDGVLARTDALFRGWFWLHHRWDVEPDGNWGRKFDYPVPDGKTGKWIADEIGRAITYWGDKVMPYQTNLKMLERFLEFQETIKIITARSPKTEAATKEWLYKWLDVPYELNMVGYHGEKLEHLMAAGVSVYVDDRFRTVNRLAGHLEHVFLINQPWNYGRVADNRVIRVDTLSDMYFKLKELDYDG